MARSPFSAVQDSDSDDLKPSSVRSSAPKKGFAGKKSQTGGAGKLSKQSNLSESLSRLRLKGALK